MVLAASESNYSQDAVPGVDRSPAVSFEELFHLYKDRVYSIALRYTGEPAAALDISQQVFVKLMASLDGFRGEAKFDSWLYRLVVNCCLDHQRLNWRWLPFVQEAIDGWQLRHGGNLEESTLDRLMRAEAQGQVRQAVAALGPDLRMAVVLRYTEGLAYDEIAEILKIPAGTVASRLNRAHKLLARRLSPLNPKQIK